MYATPTFINEAFFLVTYVRLFKTTLKMKVYNRFTVIRSVILLARVVSTICFDSKATPTNDIDYSYNITTLKPFNQNINICGSYHTASYK